MTRFLAACLGLLTAGCLGDYNKVDSICGAPCQQEGGCAPEQVAASPAEAIAVVLFQGTRPLYSTGFGSQIREIVPGSVEGSRIADGTGFPCLETGSDCFITDLAVDDARVYWTQFNGDEIWSIDPDDFEDAIRHGANPDYAAAWGRLVLTADYVFWVSEAVDGGNPGGIWRLDKYEVDGTAVGFTTDDTPHGIAVDDTHVYWTDQMGGRIRRVPLANFEEIPPPMFEDVVTGFSYPGDLQLVGDTLYVIDGNLVYSVPKDGGMPSQVGAGAGNGWSLAIVGEHAYWTDQTAIRRAQLDGSVDETLAQNLDDPRGMAVGCDLYFATYPSSGQGAGVYKMPR